MNPESLKNIHGILFKDLYPHAGVYRQVNISKDEPIMNGRSVIYADWRNIKSTLDYDFAAEKEKSYKGFSTMQIVKRIADFTSSVWKVHPFMEGNTRTTAVFIACYLNSLGFQVNNDIFKDKSLYFRNALVVANYASLMEGIAPDNEPLVQFFQNLLTGGQHQLRNRDLIVRECFSELE